MNVAVLKALEKLSLAYPSWKAGKDTLKLYAEETGDIKPEKVVRAIGWWIRNDQSGFPPSIGQLRMNADPMRIENFMLNREHVPGVEESKRRLGLR